MDAALAQKSGGRLCTSMDDRIIETNLAGEIRPVQPIGGRSRNQMHADFDISSERLGGSSVTCCFSKFNEKQCATELLFRGVISGVEGFVVESIFERFLRPNRSSLHRGEERRRSRADFCAGSSRKLAEIVDFPPDSST